MMPAPLDPVSTSNSDPAREDEIRRLARRPPLRRLNESVFSFEPLRPEKAVIRQGTVVRSSREDSVPLSDPLDSKGSPQLALRGTLTGKGTVKVTGDLSSITPSFPTASVRTGEARPLDENKMLAELLGMPSLVNGEPVPVANDPAKACCPTRIPRRSIFDGRADRQESTEGSVARAQTGILDGPVSRMGSPDLVTPEPLTQALLSPRSLEFVRNVVEFASLGHDVAGCAQFRVGLAFNSMGRMQVTVTARGERRIALQVASNSGRSSDVEAEIAALIEALRSRSIEVIEWQVDVG